MKSTNLNEESAYDISHNWFLDKSDNFTKFSNISIGHIIQIYIFELLFSKANSTSVNFSIANFFKKIGFQWQVRFFFNKFFLNSKYDKRKKYDLLLIYDVNNNPMIENLNKVAKHAISNNLSVLAVSIDLNICNKILKGIDYIFLSDLYNFDLNQKTNNGYNDMLYKFDLIKNKLSKKLINKYKLTDSNADQILTFYKKQLKQNIREILCVDLMLKNIKPQFVVCSSDAHKISRMFCIASDKHRLKSLVIQHGAPIWKYGYVPVFAKYISVWGNESKEWFIRNGVKSDKIIITGCPRYKNREFFKQKILSYDSSKKPKLFLFTNPIEVETNVGILKQFTMVESQPFESIVLKPHPSENNLNIYKKVIKLSSNQNIKVDTNSHINQLVKAGDLVVILNSTAGIDSLMNGAILVNLEIDDFPNSVPYEKYSVSIKSRLLNLSESIKKAIQIRSDFLGHSKKVDFFLNQYLNLDSNKSDSTKNIINFILEKSN